MDLPRLTRRRLLQSGLLFSAALMVPRRLLATDPTPGALHFFCLGDWGAELDDNQIAVAQAMRKYARQLGIKPQLLFLGDNFYGELSGIDSPRWKDEFEEMYPASDFPGPCYAVLGNHDYDDQPGGEKIQLAYARKPGTRWTMPHYWYRVEIPAVNPLVTLLCVSTHYGEMTEEQIKDQGVWLRQQLDAPRTSPWLFAAGHFPVVSCGPNGNSAHLAKWKTLFEEKQMDAYLCGHDHDLQHMRRPGGTTDWLVSGGGGRELYEVKPEPGVEFARESFGFLHLAVDSAQLSGTFVDAEGKPIYEFTKAVQTAPLTG